MVVSKIRVSDYISQALSSIGVKYVYGIMGGGASGLNDGFIKNKSIQYKYIFIEIFLGFLFQKI